MDTSEQYIKMCDGEEIQGLEPKDERGDDLPHQLYADENGNIAKEDDGYYYMIDNFIWLPRQDQLQEMVKDNIDCLSHSSFAILINLGNRFYKLSQDTDEYNYWIQFLSMEQLWLAFVQKELYGKVWSGEEWVAVQF